MLFPVIWSFDECLCCSSAGVNHDLPKLMKAFTENTAHSIRFVTEWEESIVQKGGQAGYLHLCKCSVPFHIMKILK